MRQIPEIIMTPHASLGPIDPQIAVTSDDGKQRQFSYEELGAFLRFLSEEAKISEQVHTVTIVEKLFNTIDPLIVGKSKRASELSTG